jgi:hypothetical protein
MPRALRAASITAICMPKQMPKYGTLRCGRSRPPDLALRAALAEAARHQDAVDMLEDKGAGSSFSKISDSIHSRLTLTLLAMPPWVSASISDL